VISFSTAPELRINSAKAVQTGTELSNEGMSPLFEAVIEATEEAIYNSLLRACDMHGNGHTVNALPLRQTLEILKKYKVSLQ
jgi:D-aminopeptidase